MQRANERHLHPGANFLGGYGAEHVAILALLLIELNNFMGALKTR